MERDFFTTFEVGKLCQVYHTTVINWINKGQLKAYTTPGKHRRIQKNDLLDFMRKFNIHIPPELQDQKKILVVDDDKSMLRLIERAFSKNSSTIQVQLISNGVEALVSVGKEIPDLIILDIVMPGMDGIEVCRTLKSNPQTEKIKIIVISGVKISEEQEKFLKKNVDEIFQKPFSILKLVDAAYALIGLEK